ncbi:CBS domain-containing protein [Streptomyces sp. NPDC058001]|uniref:CBS domain-containing protein n=1 Tax=Streptomyces sp. NPDC058001 TaxID=3346300 RepID=UPI0036ED9C27
MEHNDVARVMTGEVVSVVPETPFKDIAKLLAAQGFSGLPVLDEDDRVLGVISESDLLARQASADAERREPGGASPGAPAELTARSLMSSPAITVAASATVVEAARTMLRHGVERLPVVDQRDRLTGIVTRRDLLRVFLRPDPEIRRHVVEDVLVDALGLPSDAVGVHVIDGVVTLEGRLGDARQADLLIRLVRQSDGVVSVVDHLVRPDAGG